LFQRAGEIVPLAGRHRVGGNPLSHAATKGGIEVIVAWHYQRLTRYLNEFDDIP